MIAMQLQVLRGAYGFLTKSKEMGQASNVYWIEFQKSFTTIAQVFQKETKSIVLRPKKGH